MLRGMHRKLSTSELVDIKWLFIINIDGFFAVDMTFYLPGEALESRACPEIVSEQEIKGKFEKTIEAIDAKKSEP